jgi:hypothetical protein
MTGGERAVLVLVLVVVVGVVVVIAHFRPLARSRALTDTGLSAGLYLLTSEGCATCDRSRSTLRTRSIEFTELSWQADPEVFERLAIDAVPSVLEVAPDGSARWWRGKVPLHLRRR